ncbi:MAG: FHA domain-containing protein [Termitinemataceae bacterium]|nr:MAG: FHA domain-containing protein [Termitinemataceae bacterium]
MAKKQCSRGHIYDSAIYGDNCPFCPSQGGGTAADGGSPGGKTELNMGGTELNTEGRTQVASGTMNTGPTVPMDSGGGRTIIRPVQDGAAPSGKKLVGLLVTYSTNPQGQVFNIFEGKYFIGRDMPVDICISDNEVSGKHFSILYRSADGKFKFKDEQSSNGTFLNEVLTDEGELSSFDVIRIGGTRLIFIAIPQLPQS